MRYLLAALVTILGSAGAAATVAMPHLGDTLAALSTMLPDPNVAAAICGGIGLIVGARTRSSSPD